MSKLIIKVNPTESGLEEKKAKEIESLFLPMVKRLNEMEKAFNEVVSKEKTPETAAIARLLRLQIAAERVKAEKAKTAGKAEYLRGGNAIQGAYNLYLYASKSKEEKLFEIEKFAEVQEKERIENLKNERSTILFELGVTEDDIQHIQLGEMKSDVWENYLVGQKASFKAKKEAEKQAELDRIEEQRLDELESDRKKEVFKFAQFIDIDIELRNLSEEEYSTLVDDLNKKSDAFEAEQKEKEAEILRLNREAEQKEKKALKLKKIQDDRIKEEALKAKKAQDKLDAKIREEEEAEQKRLEAEQNKLKQGDTENIKDLIEDLIALKTKYTFKSKKFNHIYSQVGMLIDKVISHINKE